MVGVWEGGGGCVVVFFFFFKQKTAYEIYQCDWSSDVCSSDLVAGADVNILGRQPLGQDRLHRLGLGDLLRLQALEIGRASCRERV